MTQQPVIQTPASQRAAMRSGVIRLLVLRVPRRSGTCWTT